MGRSIEAGVLEDPWVAPPPDAFEWTVDPAVAPRTTRDVFIGFEAGVPVTLDGEALDGVALVERLNGEAGAYGIGRIDHVEDRLIGIKSREIYEAPSAVVLHQAHAALERLTLSRELLAHKRSVGDRLATLAYDGLWFSELAVALRAFVTHTQRYVTGEVRLRFTPGASPSRAALAALAVRRPGWRPTTAATGSTTPRPSASSRSGGSRCAPRPRRAATRPARGRCSTSWGRTGSTRSPSRRG